MVWRIAQVAVCVGLVVCFVLVAVRGSMERRRGRPLTLWQAIVRRGAAAEPEAMPTVGGRPRRVLGDDLATRRR